MPASLTQRLKPDHVTVTSAGSRHCNASALIAAGCDVVTVQRALGHSKATTTLDTYSHL
jgi:site-specific recombinase XerD